MMAKQFMAKLSQFKYKIKKEVIEMNLIFRKTSIALLASLTTLVGIPAVIIMTPTVVEQAQASSFSSNRNQVRANLDKWGHYILWGVNMNEAEVARLGGKVFLSGGGGAVSYFENLVERNTAKLKRNAAGLPEKILKDMILQSLRQGRPVYYKNVQADAGIATYQRWKRVVYHEPRTKTCWTGGYIKTKYPCTYMAEVERKISLPNHHQPYIRIRFSSR